MSRKPLVLDTVQAAGRGIVIQISADPGSTKAALEMIQETIRETESQTVRSTSNMAASYERVNAAIGHGVPQMAAASASMRALEGNFTNNIRAGERFLTMIPGIGAALQAAFPVVGAVVLGTALFDMGEKAYHAYQNIVMLKGAIDSLNALDITIGKKVEAAADAAERSIENTLEKTQGKAAAMKQKLQYESGKGIDLSDLFYDKNFESLQSNVKADYESLYKAVAPADIPDRLNRIKKEVTDLHAALKIIQRDPDATPFVGNYGPVSSQDPTKYYEARLKAAQDVQTLLQAENAKRSAALDSTKADLQHDERPKPPKSDNSVAEAAAKLQEEQAQAVADAEKVANQIHLAELDAQHKELLIKDQDFYAEKTSYELSAIDAEQKALEQKNGDLVRLYAKQHSDKTLKNRDADGNSAEELNTKRELLKVEEQINALNVKRAQISSANDAEVVLSQQAAEVASLRIAAELEKERNTSIEARSALIRREKDDEAKKNTNAGGSTDDAARIREQGEIMVQRLQMEQITQEITRTEDNYRLKVEEVNNALKQQGGSKRAAAQEINRLNAQEKADLDALLAKYTAIAQAIGDPTLMQKVVDLQAKIAILGQPNTKNDFSHTVMQDMEHMTDSIAEQALRAKGSFSDMAKSILHDAEEMALKLSEKKFIEPLFQAALGGGASSTQSGGGFSLASIFGRNRGNGAPAGGTPNVPGSGSGASSISDSGFGWGGLLGTAEGQSAGITPPSIYTPPPKQSGISFGGIATDLAKAGAQALTPKVTSNIINQSSAPVTAADPEVSYDQQMKEYVINLILQDHQEGGPISMVSGSQ